MYLLLPCCSILYLCYLFESSVLKCSFSLIAKEDHSLSQVIVQSNVSPTRTSVLFTLIQPPTFSSFMNFGMRLLRFAFSFGLTDAENANLTHGQKILLKWHFRLAHCDFSIIWCCIGNHGWLGTNGFCLGDPMFDSPKCAACSYGKAKHVSTKAQTITVNPAKEGNINQDALQPGDQISMDQIVVCTQGHLFSTCGHEKSDDLMFTGGIIFVDEASSRIDL